MKTTGWMIASLGAGLALVGVAIGAFAIGVNEGELPPAPVGSCAAYAGLPVEEGDMAGMTFVRGGAFQMGSERHQPEERSTHLVRVDGFWIDRHEVTNAQFKQFVDATGHRTLAERGLDPAAHPHLSKEVLVPGSVVFIKPTDLKQGGRTTQWWQYVAGADWRHPTGPGSSIAGKDNHPVVPSPMRMRLPMRAGTAAICRPRRSGNSRRVGGATARTIGRAPSTPPASRSPTRGRASSRSSTPTTTATRARHLSAASRRTVTGSTT
jgi:hypothetical protein